MNSGKNTSSKRSSLQTRFLVLLLATSLIPLILVSIRDILQTQTALTNAAKVSLLASAGQTATSLDTFVKNTLDSVRVEAQFKIFIDYLALPTSQKTGSSQEANAKDLLARLRNKDTVNIISYAIVESSGKILLDTVSENIGKSEMGDEYFKKVTQSQLPIVTAVTYATDGTSNIHFASVIRNENGDFAGILRIEYNPSILQQIGAQNLQSAVVGTDVILLDEYNIRMADIANPDLIQKSIIPLPTDKFNKAVQAGRLLSGMPAEQQSSNLPDLELALTNSNTEPFFTTDISPNKSGTDTVAVANMQTQPWKVIYSQPTDVLLSEVQRQTYTNAFIVFAVAIALIFIALFSTRWFTAPIIQLTKTANTVAQGNLNERSNITSSDELGTLASAFNDMTGRLQETLGTLETRVEERTQALATVADIGTATSTIMDVDKLLYAVVELSKERFNLYHSHIYLLDDTGENLVLAAGAGEPGRVMVSEGRSISLSREQSLVARAARERRGVTINDVTQAPDFLPNPLLPETRSELAVPMIVGNKVIGVFDIQSDQIGRFTESDVNIQTTLAAQIGVSMQNAKQVQRSITLAAELSGFQNAVSEAAIIATTDVSGKIDMVNQKLIDISKYSREELIGQDHRMLNSGYHPKEFIRDLWVTIANGRVWRNEIKNKAKDGSFYWVDTTIAPILNEQGKPVKYVAIRFDITQRKEFELEATKRAAHVQALDNIAQKIQSATKIETALQIAARELGHALGMKPTSVSIDQEALSGERKADS
jgi:PAS domain S-box-containing protein